MTEKKQTQKTKSGKQKRIFGKWVFVMVAIIVIGVISGSIIYYQSRIAPLQQTVLRVDNDSIQMNYFLKRAKMTGSEISEVLQQLTYELIIKTEVPKQGIDVTEMEISKTLRDMALASKAENNDESVLTGENSGITDEEFNSWYQQQLATNHLTETEYREIVRINLLADRFQEYLASKIPAQMEQVHLGVITVGTKDEAEKARNRIISGENFSIVAADVSTDSLSRAAGGDIGWIPRGVMPYDEVVFQLKPGQISNPVTMNPVAPDTSQFAIFLVTEKQENREITQSIMEILKSRALYVWLNQVKTEYSIEYDLSPDDQVWVNSQLAK